MNIDPDPAAPFLTKQEVADLLRCSVRQVERLMREGLPFIPVGSRKNVFCAESVKRWLMSREVCFSPPPKHQVIVSRSLTSEPNEYVKYCMESVAKREARELKRRLKTGAK